jgi:hypothetical protein
MTDQHTIVILGGLITLFNGVIIAALAWVGNTVREIRNQLRLMNGRLAHVEEWKTNVPVFCNERHAQNDREHVAFKSQLEYLTRGQMSGKDPK